MDLVVRANFGYLVAICHLSDNLSDFYQNMERLLTFQLVRVAHDVAHDF